MENPFKFGTIVDDEYFTDRVNEVAYIRQFLDGPNHLVLISPRRFGKSSVVAKVLRQIDRKSITVNMQNVTSVTDLSAKLLRAFFKIHPLERVRHLVSHFRIIPTVSTNPLTGAIDVAFQPGMDGVTAIEDTLTLIERAHSNDDRLVIVYDEFQEIHDIAPRLDRQLRAMMQEQQHVNYILLGSQESMMTDIFENKKSPFYHFAQMMRLSKLPRDDFFRYIEQRLSGVYPECSSELANSILDYTACHPYYSQQLAANVWQVGMLQPETQDVLGAAIKNIVETHTLDYERLWMGMNRTNRWILQRLATNDSLMTGEQRTSTVYSALKRLQKEGYVIYSDKYEIEDPFYRQWIAKER